MGGMVPLEKRGKRVYGGGTGWGEKGEKKTVAPRYFLDFNGGGEGKAPN